MLFRSLHLSIVLPVIMGLLVMASGGLAGAQIIQEDFNAVSGTGGGPILTGQGFNELTNWDDGLLGENAFAGTVGNARVNPASASGSTTGGVGGSGAGVVTITGVTFDILDEPFSTVTNTGGGIFLLGDGITPDTSGFTPSWDDGISGEGAFGGTFNGAVVIGSMRAEGLPAGGLAGGGGRLIVDSVDTTLGNWFAGLVWDIGPFPGSTPVFNPQFDDNGGSLDNWSTFGNAIPNVLAEPVTPRSGTHVCKMFGQFTGSPNESGIFQSLPAQPGQIWQLDVFSRHNTGDSLIATSNLGLMRIEFLDATGTTLLFQQQTVLDALSPLDIWIDNTPLQLTAPPGTVEVRPVLAFSQPAPGLFEPGAALFDDVSFKVVGGPTGVNLANFSLNANVQGTANVGLGEVLSGIQLRIEDLDGNRRIFSATADGTWQAMGGLLSTSVEADPNGVPTPGVFNVNSAGYKIVVAFDNDVVTPWGPGGTLAVDDLFLSNTDPTGSSWFAGLFWDNLTVPPGFGLPDLTLTADVQGSIIGGDYELRVEAFKSTFAGLNDSFDGATGLGGDVLLDPAAVMAGQTFGFSNDYDTGITGEGAFGGIFGLVDILPGGGIFAEGLIAGGNGGGGAAQIRVENMAVGPGGGWFAGLDWPNQGLASTTDLSTVMLTADIKGSIPMTGGFLGDYELRIEDAQGDRLYFPMTANSAWQAVGGPLSTALEGAALSGAGDGTFNLDSPTYSVVVSFINPETTWQFGGILTVDNLFLTPVTINTEIGRVAFPGTADGMFQNVGGLLSSGMTNFGDFSEDFSSATGLGGGPFPPGNAPNWDTGIANENAFFGTFGNAVINVGASVQGCTTCGVGGSGGAQLTISDVPPNTGGWFAGMFFSNVPADLSAGLDQITLSANIQGTANAMAGESLGTYFLRIEDSDLTALSFTVTADGTFQSVGGLLSTATLEQINTGDGVFDMNQSTYTLTVGFVGTATNWGPGGMLTLDDLFLTGIQFGDADTYTVTLAFENEISTWGAAGMLTIDNLLFTQSLALTPGDTNCDGSVNGLDIQSFALAIIDPAGYAAQFPMCNILNADTNGDSNVDIGDIASFATLLTGM